jgi:hypothetical protein
MMGYSLPYIEIFIWSCSIAHAMQFVLSCCPCGEHLVVLLCGVERLCLLRTWSEPGVLTPPKPFTPLFGTPCAMRIITTHAKGDTLPQKFVE